MVDGTYFDSVRMQVTEATRAQFERAHRKTMAVHAGLFRRLAASPTMHELYRRKH
jgi:hypothetical protein